MYNAMNEDLMFMDMHERADAMRHARSSRTTNRRFWHRSTKVSVPAQVARRAR